MYDFMKAPFEPSAKTFVKKKGIFPTLLIWKLLLQLLLLYHCEPYSL